ncbi:MAG: putative DNA modification/repair radical SAM protein [Rubricoccaceae bacterium]|nr:putative DNA modification/repair radical SAM protein [Rubricoccaceae bacterium]
MRTPVIEKLEILADAAKYDVSCASSGSTRKNSPTGLGNSTGIGICHSYTEDGRCVSLLKLLFTNHCIYDCAYCPSRRSNDVRRVAFTVQEVVDLTLGFYRRNYIEGLFLSSGIFKDADTTTERLVRVARTLRETHDFHGYIHLKVIPGASDELMLEAGRWADRLSVNLEIPSERGLRSVAPEKSYADALGPMATLRDEIDGNRAARAEAARPTNRPRVKPTLFAPGGQSTQLVVGATPEDDRTVLSLADRLYREERLKRVYYSGFIPVSDDARVPQPETYRAPLRREHRLYQADWLLRRYSFQLDEIVDPARPMLDEDVDPKTAYALRFPSLFPVDVNTAPYEWLLRVPGVGVRSAKRIVAARRHGTVRWEHLRAMGVVLKRAQYFLTVPGHRPHLLDRDPGLVRLRIVGGRQKADRGQLDLFGAPLRQAA